MKRQKFLGLHHVFRSPYYYLEVSTAVNGDIKLNCFISKMMVYNFTILILLHICYYRATAIPRTRYPRTWNTLGVKLPQEK